MSTIDENDVSLAGLPETIREEAARRLAAVQERIESAATRAGRDPSEIRLVGVAKKQPLSRVVAAVGAGLRVLGQSYLQETRDMRPLLEQALARDPATAEIRLEWRMVGRVQRNKAALAARLFDAVESVDRMPLVHTLGRKARDEGRPLDVLVQVSLCGEAQKGGCSADDLPALIDSVTQEEGLCFRGLMTVPAANPDPEAARPVFQRLRALRDQLAPEDEQGARSALSMGMSADLEVAVSEGATLVRVGTALFGERVLS